MSGVNNENLPSNQGYHGISRTQNETQTAELDEDSYTQKARLQTERLLNSSRTSSSSLNSWNFKLQLPNKASVGKAMGQFIKALTTNYSKIIQHSLNGQLKDSTVRNCHLTHHECRWIAQEIAKATNYERREEQALKVFYRALGRTLSGEQIFALLKDPKVPQREILGKSYVRAVGPSQYYKDFVKAYSTKQVTSFLLETRPHKSPLKKEFLLYRHLEACFKTKDRNTISHLVQEIGKDEMISMLEKVQTPRAERFIDVLYNQYFS